jgi:hypothetical protein
MLSRSTKWILAVQLPAIILLFAASAHASESASCPTVGERKCGDCYIGMYPEGPRAVVDGLQCTAIGEEKGWQLEKVFHDDTVPLTETGCENALLECEEWVEQGPVHH